MNETPERAKLRALIERLNDEQVEAVLQIIHLMVSGSEAPIPPAPPGVEEPPDQPEELTNLFDSFSDIEIEVGSDWARKLGLSDE